MSNKNEYLFGCLFEIIGRYVLLFLIAFLIQELYGCSANEQKEVKQYSNKRYRSEHYDDDYAEWRMEQEAHEGLSQYDRWQ